MDKIKKTPKELIEMFPNCGLNSVQIGYLHWCKALRGDKYGTQTVIEVESFENFLQYQKKYVHLNLNE